MDCKKKLKINKKLIKVKQVHFMEKETLQLFYYSDVVMTMMEKIHAINFQKNLIKLKIIESIKYSQYHFDHENDDK